jgi:Rrf2 family protein
MILSRSSEYAISAAVQLARAEPRTWLSCAEIARPGRMPVRFLLHILRRLVEHGVVRSTRGATGGYMLARPPKQITVLQILNAVENSTGTQWPFIPGTGNDCRARLAKSLQAATRAANVHLQNVTLADLIKQKRGTRKRR